MDLASVFCVLEIEYIPENAIEPMEAIINPCNESRKETIREYLAQCFESDACFMP